MYSKFFRLSAVLVLAIFSASAGAQSACGPVEILTDEAGDWSGTIGGITGVGAGLPEQDVLGLTLEQSEANGETLLTFRILTDGAPLLAAPPAAAWFSSFETPDGVVYGVRLQTGPTGAKSFFSYVVGASNAGTTDGRFVTAGTEKPAEAGSEFSADGVVKIVVKASNIGISAGQTLGPFNAATTQSTPVGLVAFTVDEAPTGLGRDGFYDIQGSCGGKSGSGLALAGGMGFALLLPLALLGLRRRLTLAPH